MSTTTPRRATSPNGTRTNGAGPGMNSTGTSLLRARRLARTRLASALAVAMSGGLLLLGSITACDRTSEPAAQVAEIEAREGQHYSAYAVETPTNASFHIVTFKDVGIRHFTPNLEPLYETVAESLALQMTSLADPAWTARAAYRAELLDPANHRHCATRHIYVDVWTSMEPDRWGYSLWSGCGEDDQFAWTELPMTSAAADDLVGHAEALTTSILGDLRSAQERGCWTRTC